MNSTITPHKAREWRRAWRSGMAALRAELRAIRIARATGTFLEREDADRRLDAAWHEHRLLQAALRRLQSAAVVKYSAVSTAAAVRLAKHRG